MVIQDERSLYTVLSVSFPANERTEMLSMNLDMAGICVSGGSACSSGAQGGSHVIKAVYPHDQSCYHSFFIQQTQYFDDEIDTTIVRFKS
jgi:cysteine desulfurase